MTEQQFQSRCAARLSEVDDNHPDVKARIKAFNDTLSDMRRRHVILIDKDKNTIHDLQNHAIVMDVNEGKAVYHTNVFNKVFYKYK